MNIELGTIAFVVLIGIVAANPGIVIPTWVLIFLLICLVINVASLTYNIMEYRDMRRFCEENKMRFETETIK